MLDDHQLWHANWRPLEAILPLALCGPFMWMHPAASRDGDALEAYKHRETRRYLLLDGAGAPYGAGEDGLERIRHHCAIEHAFPAGWVLHADEADRVALREILDAAGERDTAELRDGDGLPAVSSLWPRAGVPL